MHTSVQKRLPFTISQYSVANERHPLRNEDSILIDETSGLVAVFDGVGGSAAAEIASQTAARSTINGWRKLLRQFMPRKRKLLGLIEDCQRHDLRAILEHLMTEAHEQVRTNGAERAGTDDLATTVAMAAFCRNPEMNSYSLFYGHVGDSRVYLLPARDQNNLERLTSDDGLLSRLVEIQTLNEFHAFRIDQATRAEDLSDIEYSYFRMRGGITQALGASLPPVVHTGRTTVFPGDRILLCTDGIHDNLTDEEIKETLRNSPRSSAARLLVEQSQRRSREDRSKTIRPKPDDMSAIVITCRF
ncbi:PP2C family protein-serine/threonine phosphatase [Tengunoibacter tsumagoiensis]|uniref:PPM-type phosphatase domain-containing protein n=1 Tax=Tengunoibacter tsumagoiensis TaxID=2014871 RepID=A0A401ZZ71_9CHLR|nr:PP2C family serine/threonine-protein phosphatase [Tengunoibacter tsumagoiensis]GCE12140.1 hypothetical protein KTT_19990 [Tengunoibacter tsumagoiensis]